VISNRPFIYAAAVIISAALASVPVAANAFTGWTGDGGGGGASSNPNNQLTSPQLPDAVTVADLEAKAIAAVPLIKDAQPERLAKSTIKHVTDVAGFSFRCERFGDFLALFVERAGKKTVEAVNVARAWPIVLTTGHTPDLGGSAYIFIATGVNAGGKVAYSLMLSDLEPIPGVEQLNSWAWGNDGPVTVVTGIARDADDDRIEFGGAATARSGWATLHDSGNSGRSGGGDDYVIDDGIGANTTIHAAPDVPVSLSVPAGQGAVVYAQMLAALRAGVPPSPAGRWSER
jgi:hypothetical protein